LTGGGGGGGGRGVLVGTVAVSGEVGALVCSIGVSGGGGDISFFTAWLDANGSVGGEDIPDFASI
jgi:hypothetical protein